MAVQLVRSKLLVLVRRGQDLRASVRARASGRGADGVVHAHVASLHARKSKVSTLMRSEHIRQLSCVTIICDVSGGTESCQPHLLLVFYVSRASKFRNLANVILRGVCFCA